MLHKVGPGKQFLVESELGCLGEAGPTSCRLSCWWSPAELGPRQPGRLASPAGRALGSGLRGWRCRLEFVHWAFSERTGLDHTKVLTLRRFLFAKLLVTTSTYRVGRWCCVLWFASTGQLTFTADAAAAAKSLQSCPTLCDPIDGSPPGSPSLGFSRQEHWSGLPFPSPMNKSEKWKWSRSVVSDS